MNLLNLDSLMVQGVLVLGIVGGCSLEILHRINPREQVDTVIKVTCVAVLVALVMPVLRNDVLTPIYLMDYKLKLDAFDEKVPYEAYANGQATAADFHDKELVYEALENIALADAPQHLNYQMIASYFDTRARKEIPRLALAEWRKSQETDINAGAS